MAFHLFRSDESLHLDGRKEQTIQKPYSVFEPNAVYVPAENRGLPLRGLLPAGTPVRRGTLLGVKDPDDFPVYSPVSGTIVGHEKVFLPTGVETNCLKIENDKKGTWEIQNPLKESKDCSEKEILDALKKSGQVGFGGAGFPTYRKYQTVRPVDTLIINAVECEPYLTADYLYGCAEIEQVFIALPYLLKAAEAKKAYFAVKKDRPLLISAFEEEKKKHPEIPVELSLLPDAYPMGYERTLVREIVHKEYDALPIEAGVIVNNIATFIGLGMYFREGKPAVLKAITVAGEVKDPKTVLTPYGVLASELIGFCGGATVKDYKIVNGGPMCGDAMPKDYATLLQTNGVLVLSPNALRAEPCWHCGKCCDQCPMDLQPVQIQMALKRNDLERMIELEADKCCGCGLCSYVCPSHIEVTQNVLKAKALVIAAKKEASK
jgi:electron transport complex protein RnfC